VLTPAFPMMNQIDLWVKITATGFTFTLGMQTSLLTVLNNLT